MGARDPEGVKMLEWSDNLELWIYLSLGFLLSAIIALTPLLNLGLVRAITDLRGRILEGFFRDQDLILSHLRFPRTALNLMENSLLTFGASLRGVDWGLMRLLDRTREQASDRGQLIRVYAFLMLVQSVLGFVLALAGICVLRFLSVIGFSIGLLTSRTRRAPKPTRDSHGVYSDPPSAAQYLLELLAPADWSETAVGDLFELYERRFRRVSGKYGLFRAKVHYWVMVLRSAPGLLRIRSRHLAALAGIVKLLEVLRKHWVAR
jgi:hypothetical protein